jgi:hypothetical protein
MGSEIHRLKRRRATLGKMDALLEHASTTLVIHYSCESFYEREDGRTHRVTSIAVRNLASGQTDSFAIHQVAEERHVPFEQIDQRYDELEVVMLERFFDFVRAHQHYTWIHWNMRDANYGFAAIEHRYRVLGGVPLEITEERKFDLARALVDLFGVRYAAHPRLTTIIKLNKITDRDFLTGAEEASAFERKDYVKLHQSTLRKVDTLANLFERACSKTLKTNATWAEQYGLTPAVLVEVLKTHWLVTAIVVIGGVLTFVLRLWDFILRLL